MRRTILGLSALLALAGCSQTNTPPSPSSFDLPGDVSFGCVRREVRGAMTPPAAFVALAECRVEDDADDPKTHSLVAFVTQVATGEVAAVDLRENRSLDSDVRVPGFTYVRVGEIPTGLVTIEPTATSPSVTFVSSFGSRQLQALDTARFHPDVPDTEGYATTSVDLPEGPTDVVFVPAPSAGRIGYLYAPLPASGQIAQVPVSDAGRLVDELVLLDLDPDPLNALGPTVEDEIAPYERICPMTPGYATATATPVASGAPAAASPMKLELDGDSTPPVLLVADDASPVIHRLTVSPAGATAIEGLAVGVPTRDLAVTPPVAPTIDADPLTNPAAIDRRYLYAIDATDGSVLAVDYTSSSPSFGAVLAVNVGDESSNRIAFREPARALEVITPELGLADNDPVNDTPGVCSPDQAGRADDASPALLRGVYLSVGLESGFVSVVDVWDLEAPCRGGAQCQNPAVSEDVFVAIRRHRPRIASFVADPPVVPGTPALTFETNPGLLDEDTGRPTSGSGPGLAPVDCPPDLWVQGFPDPEEAATARICLRNDPWSGLNQRFTATFDGPIPLANGGDGVLVDLGGGQLRLDAPNGRFCELGVLGADDVVASGLGPDDPEVGYGGDMLEIVGDIPPDVARDMPDACAAFDLPDDGAADDRDPILFQVVAASDASLVLTPIGGTVGADVLLCFPHPTAYRVRTRGAYTVASSGQPLLHRVVSQGGACRVDTAAFPVAVGDPDTYRNFRAIPQRTFIHPLVAFEITLAGANQDVPLVLDQESQLVFDVSRYPAKLAVDLGTIPIVAAMRWNPIDDRLYVVDEGQYRVTQIDTEPFSIVRFFD